MLPEETYFNQFSSRLKKLEFHQCTSILLSLVQLLSTLLVDEDIALELHIFVNSIFFIITKPTKIEIVLETGSCNFKAVVKRTPPVFDFYRFCILKMEPIKVGENMTKNASK